MHLHARLPRERVEVVPGIPGMAGCWAATGLPITWGDDILTVLPATLPEEDLTRRIRDTDALVVMKIGRNLPRLRAALESAGRADRAWLIEHGTMAEERVRMLSEVEGPVPYFSIVLVHGRGRGLLDHQGAGEAPARGLARPADHEGADQEGASIRRHERVGEVGARGDRRLGDAADAVHGILVAHPVPV